MIRTIPIREDQSLPQDLHGVFRLKRIRSLRVAATNPAISSPSQYDKTFSSVYDQQYLFPQPEAETILYEAK